jgi:Zn-dependent peptidase ImmA (M78 family)
MFNPKRLELARKRRRLSSKILAERANLSPVTLSRIMKGLQKADSSSIEALVSVLGYPAEFYELDDPKTITTEAASFRSLSSMSAKERDAALSAGTLAFEFVNWVSREFDLPVLDLDLGSPHETDPSTAARLLRTRWGIGEKPISNMIKLLETKGIRVFSLAEDTRNVDAFSCWRDEEAFIFLNTFKSAEHSRFDAAHELGHLVLHRHGGPRGREAEFEANQFASAFLMPKGDVLATIPFVSSVSQIVKAKRRWGVSAVALAYRLNKMGLMTEWQYIQVNRQYRSKEPDPLPHEQSGVWQQVLTELWRDGISRAVIAKELLIPEEELANLMFGLTGEFAQVKRDQPYLRVV